MAEREGRVSRGWWSVDAHRHGRNPGSPLWGRHGNQQAPPPPLLLSHPFRVSPPFDTEEPEGSSCMCGQ